MEEELLGESGPPCDERVKPRDPLGSGPLGPPQSPETLSCGLEGLLGRCRTRPRPLLPWDLLCCRTGYALAGEEEEEDEEDLCVKALLLDGEADDLIYADEQLKDEIADVTHEMDQLNVPVDSKGNPKARQLAYGRKTFNMDPKKGIAYLVENELVRRTAGEVAEFLFSGEGLNKTAIGEYLGERDDFNIEVLRAFVDRHQFQHTILVQALRSFLWSFRLPGEAQKIDRMMEQFARRYCECNSDVFSTPDTCYVLAFSIIMLNTSLHNPSVKDKPTVEQFIKMNRGINDGQDLPDDLQKSLYESIKKEPFKIPEDDGNDLMHTFFNPDKEGWLLKQGGRVRTWKRRWFILKDHCLYYFEYTTDKEPKGIIPLENVQIREGPDSSKQNCFEIYSANVPIIKACKVDSQGKVVEGKHSVYRMSASTAEEKASWIQHIRACIADSPFYDLLSARRRKAAHQ